MIPSTITIAPKFFMPTIFKTYDFPIGKLGANVPTPFIAPFWAFFEIMCVNIPHSLHKTTAKIPHLYR